MSEEPIVRSWEGCRPGARIARWGLGAWIVLVTAGLFWALLR